MALDIKALARAAYDPQRYPGAYSDEKRRLKELFSAEALAAISDSRSVAARNNPNDNRSLAARQYPGLFGTPVDPRGNGGVTSAPDMPQPAGLDGMYRAYYGQSTDQSGLTSYSNLFEQDI